MAFDHLNDLERSLVKAATDPAHRPQFYRDFLAAEIFAIEGGPLRTTATTSTLVAGAHLALRSWQQNGRTIIPIFSSLPRLQAALKERANYLAIQTPDFLRLTRGAALLLNPGSKYGKEFLPEEIASLLDGSIWQPIERFVAEKGTRVRIGQPANYPTELIAVLTRYFQTTPQVQRAFLAHFFNPDHDQKPHTLIALETTGDWDQVIAGAGVVLASVVIPDPPVDFTRLTATDGFRSYFTHVKPFYEKKKRFLGLF